MMKDIEIKINRETRMVDLSKSIIGNDGENLQGNLVFSFTDDFVKGQARLEYVIDDEKKYALLLKDEDNYYIPIKSVMTKAGTIDMQLVITEGTNENEIPIFKSNMFYVTCRTSINAEIEEEEGYYSWIEIANTKLNEVDEAIEELASQSNYAKEQGDYAKEQGTNAKNVADDTQKKAEEGKFNGKSLEFIWQGTKLGVRLEGQEEYQFVDLQGVQGEIGATGEPFKIKKTYASVSEMNADFRNMVFGDYVMIASSVDVEDNAKLYTRGESAWIFISDFSGAMGVRGETGLTPNIKIGEVKTLEAGSQAKVTRSGSNEEPVFNFELPKGDKGDDYVLTEEDKVEIGEKVNTEYEKRIAENEKDIVDIESYLDSLTPKAPPVKGELVHITDALPLPTFENKVDGNVKQETTKGYQLLPNTKLTSTSRGVTLTYDNGTLTATGTATETGYANFNLPFILPKGVIHSQSSGDFSYRLLDSSYNVICGNETQHNNKTLETEVNVSHFALIVNQGQTYNGTQKIMVSVGTSDLEWEQNTNGASPNPEFPQEIEVLEAYNLLNVDVKKNLYNGLEVTPVYKENGKLDYINVNGTATANSNFRVHSSQYYDIDKQKIYTISGSPSDGSQNTYGILAYYYDENNIYIDGKYDIGSGVQLPQASKLVINIFVRSGITMNNVKFYPMLVEGTEKKPYLPYGCVGYKNVGKNLLNLNTTPIYVSGASSTFNEPNITITKTSPSLNASCVFIVGDANILNGKTLKYTGELLSGTGRAIIGYAAADGGNRVTIAGNTNINSGTFERTITVDGTTYANKKVVVWLYSDVLTTGNIGDKTIYKNVMVSENGGEYEPFQEQTVPLDLKGNWVGKISDDIKDYLVTDKKKYWLVKNVGKVVFNGSESWWLQSGIEYRVKLNNSKFYGKALSNYFINSENKTNGSMLIYQAGYLRIYKDSNSLEEFKQWLSENNVEVVYQLATPEIIELGELPEPIKTFEGVNNIQVLANLDTEIEVKYALDLKKYYDNKLAEISAQII